MGDEYKARYRGLAGIVRLALTQMGIPLAVTQGKLAKSPRATRISSGDPTGGRAGPNAQAVRDLTDPQHRISLLEEEVQRLKRKRSR